jgi:hypothetical protein
MPQNRAPFPATFSRLNALSRQDWHSWMVMNAQAFIASVNSWYDGRWNHDEFPSTAFPVVLLEATQECLDKGLATIRKTTKVR